MIYFICGRPGGGKSLTTAEYIYKALKRGKNVIANFEINMDYFKKCRHPEKLGKFIYVSDYEWKENAYKNLNPKDKKFSYIDGLWGFYHNYHEHNLGRNGRPKENQTLLILDECANLFNSRTFQARDRLEWCYFFRQHRKLRYKVYLIAQDDNDIDKQIRELFESQVECRCVNNYKFFGKVLGLLCGGKLFVRIFRNYAVKKGGRRKDSREGSEFFTGRKYYAFYDSYKLFG